MGTRGPVPKPSAARRRTNKPEIPVKTATRGKKTAPAVKPAPKKRVSKKIAAEVVAEEPRSIRPAEEPSWHPTAKMIYQSLADSGQSEFMEASDWAIAFLFCESVSRDLGEQVVGVTPSGKILYSVIPIKGASLSAYMKICTDLLMTEGARRRASVELTRGEKVDPDAEAARASITDIATERLRVAK